MRSVLSVAIPVLAALGCASSGKSSVPAGGQAAEIRFHDSRTGLEMAIVNDSHLVRLGIEGETVDERRLAFYSRIRDAAGPKVTTDEILAALIDYLDERGFDRLATTGPLGAQASGSIAIEVATGPITRHAVRKAGMSAEDALSFNEIVMVFSQTYNAIPQYQAYDGHPAQEIFQSPQGRE